MLKELYSAIRYVLWDARVKRSFDAFLIMASWLLAIALLAVSVPHATDVINIYERNDEFKAICFALASEATPSLLLLIALHTAGLATYQKYWLLGLAVPFVLLTLHLQFVYYAGPKTWLIYPWELGAVLPYGVIALAVSIAFLWPLVSKAKEDIASRIQAEIDAVEAKWRLILGDKEQELAALSNERDSARQELDKVTDNASQVIRRLESELAKKPKELAKPSIVLPERETIRVEILKPYKDGKANQGETLDKLFNLLGFEDTPV